MAKIHINNPKQVINGGAKKYYFKVKGLGGPKGDKGDKGDTGATGPQGPQGNAATVSIGSTTTLPVGNDATVTNSGSIYNAVLNFGIPQGPRGPQGATGAKGDKGDKGDQGNPGPQGEKGTNATVTVGTTTTTEPGTQAYAWNSSSNPNNAVINFNIPRGATGATGATGPQGPTGPAGADGADGQDGQNFTPTIVETLPTTGDQSKLYLTPKAHTTSTATGNPIEATVTEQAGQLESFQLDGDTFQQSYTGKNLFDPSATPWVEGIAYNTAGPQYWSGYYGITGYQPVEASTQYTFSNDLNKPIHYGIAYYNSSKSLISTTTADTTTFTTPANCAYIRFAIQSPTAPTWTQLELGSTATSYEPYVGGQPSPNPSYPQDINVVTGTQTITINGTDYPISLGSLELCKLGTYQDYIYKDGEDWKVHKETKRISVDGSQRSGSITQYGFAQIRIDSEALYVSAPPVSYCSNLPSHDIYNSLPKTYAIRSSSTQCNFRLYFTPQLENFADYLDWCAENKPSVVAPLQQSDHTDTTITDTTLIAQLEAVRTASLENGTNTITNTATGTNLAGDMEIGYFGYNPRNRYDKWLWLDLNNNYEQIGS